MGMLDLLKNIDAEKDSGNEPACPGFSVYKELKNWLGDSEACLNLILDGVKNLDSLISKNS